MEKIDYKKEFSDLYKQSAKEPSIVMVPKMNYIMTDGEGDPNTSELFQQSVEALYTVSYAIKFCKKKTENFDYAVMPLEGLWWAEDMEEFSVERKNDWKWRLMIMQPEPVTFKDFETGLETAKKKKPDLDALNSLKFKEFKEGTSVQIMHIGPFENEGPTIEKIHKYAADQGYNLNGKHHEIYLSDFRKSAPEKLKTILRQPIEKIETGY